jgi:hypothetical protein
MIVTTFVTEESVESVEPVRKPWESFGVLAPLVPLGVAAMVLALVRVVQENDAGSWLSIVFAGLGCWVITTSRGHHPWGLVSAVLLGVATWFAGRGLWSPEPPYDVADRLLGENLPGVLRYTTLLLLILSTLGLIAVGVYAWCRRDTDLVDEPGAARRSVALLAVGAVLAGVAWLGGGLWAAGTADAVRADSEDHTTAAGLPDPRQEPPRGPEGDLAQVWQVGDDVRYGDQAALVPGTDLAVAFGFDAGVATDYGLFVLDARTGDERWHYRIRSTANTSAGGFMGAVVGTRTGTVLAVVSNVGILFDLDTGQVRSRFALPHVPGEPRYRVLSDSPVPSDRTAIQVSGQPVGYLAAHGEDVATLLSVDLNTGDVRTADRAPSGACHYQYAGPSTTDIRGDGAFLVRSGRECGQPVVLSMTRERVAGTFDLPAVDQNATSCAEPDCDGPVVSAAAGRLVVDVGGELHAFDREGARWTTPVAPGAQVTAVGPSGDQPHRVVVETPAGTTVLDGDTGATLGPLAALPGTGRGGEVTPETGWYRIHRLDDRTIELVRVDLGSLTAVTRSEPVSCGKDLAIDPPPLSAASGRLLVTCWPVREATTTVLGD